MIEFSETELTAAVVDSFRDTPNPRAKFLLQILFKLTSGHSRIQ